jgi:hypothetical protein
VSDAVKEGGMSLSCVECGAPLHAGETCQEKFHALLLLEGQVTDAPGSIIHFYTVACYVLQHPDSMNYTALALHGLRDSLGDALDGRATLDELRRRARVASDGATRITRREGDPGVRWRRGGWEVTVADVCTLAPEQYISGVLRWARSIRETLAGDPA